MHAIDRFCHWLEETSLSLTIQSVPWIVPTVQTIHILAISTVMASALMIDLRLAGLAGLDQSQRRVFQRFLPVIWWTLAVLLVTGAIMILGEPARSLKNPIFQLKMALLVAAIAVTVILASRLRRSGELSRKERLPLAVVSMLLWIAIVFAGRWIAYY
jgi:uncharacterized membrane protein SirB2